MFEAIAGLIGGMLVEAAKLNNWSLTKLFSLMWLELGCTALCLLFFTRSPYGWLTASSILIGGMLAISATAVGLVGCERWWAKRRARRRGAKDKDGAP